MYCHSNYPLRYQGFTLIELIMVIVIVGVLAASARALLSTEAFEKRYFVDETLMAMRYAQQVAITQGCAVQFQINNNVGFYLRQDQNCANAGAVNFTANVYLPRPGTNEDYLNTEWPDGVTLTLGATPSTVIFYPQGWACAAAGTNNSVYSYSFSSTFTIFLDLVCATGFSYER